MAVSLTVYLDNVALAYINNEKVLKRLTKKIAKSIHAFLVDNLVSDDIAWINFIRNFYVQEHHHYGRIFKHSLVH